MILRDYWFCWVSVIAEDLLSAVLCAYQSVQILSIAFELAEYSLQHQLPNFAEVRLRKRIGSLMPLRLF